MNKRQAKKARKKVTYPFVDEMNLLTLSPEEYEKAMKDFHEWVYKNCRYFHYRDKYKKIGFNCYHFPVGEAYKERIERMLETFVPKQNAKIKVVMQNLNDLCKSYKPTESGEDD